MTTPRTPQTEDLDLHKLKRQMQVEFLGKLYEIMSDSTKIDEAVEGAAYVRKDNKPIDLKQAEKENAFKKDGSKNDEIKNITIDNDRIEGFIKGSKTGVSPIEGIPQLQNQNLTLKEKVIISSVIGAASSDVRNKEFVREIEKQLKTEEQTLPDQYIQGAETPEDKDKNKQISALITKNEQNRKDLTQAKNNFYQELFTEDFSKSLVAAIRSPSPANNLKAAIYQLIVKHAEKTSDKKISQLMDILNETDESKLISQLKEFSYRGAMQKMTHLGKSDLVSSVKKAIKHYEKIVKQHELEKHVGITEPAPSPRKK